MSKVEDARDLEKDLSIQEHLSLEEWELRKDIAKKIIRTFVTANLVVLAAIAAMFVSDVVFICGNTIKPSERLIESKVIIAMISALTVQLGAIALAVSKWLFPVK